MDIRFQEILENYLSKLDHTCNLVTITPSRIEALIQFLKSRKAPRSDGLQPKHLIHGTPKLFEHLAILFQALAAQQYILDALCEGIVTCVPKKNKDPKSCDSYRPITVCSVLGKLFEKVLYREISHKCDHRDQQFGFPEGLGIQNAHAAFLAIFECHKHSKRNLYVCAIDISKAFEKILHSQGILSLLRSGVDPFICACLWKWY